MPPLLLPVKLARKSSPDEFPQGDPPGPVHRIPLYDGTSFEGTYLFLFYLRQDAVPPALLDSQAVQRRGHPIVVSRVTFSFLSPHSGYIDLDH